MYLKKSTAYAGYGADYVTRSNVARDIYIATDGLDLPSGGGSAEQPLLTPQYAIDRTPNLLTNDFNFFLTSGQFNGQINLLKLQGVASSVNYVRIVGSRKIILDDTQATSVGSNFVTVTGAEWEVDAFKGKMFVAVSGTGYSALGKFFTFPLQVLSNTEDTIYFVRTNINVSYNATTHFIIYEPETILANTLSYVLKVYGTQRATQVWLWDCEIGGGSGFYTTYLANSLVHFAGCKFEKKNTEVGFLISQMAEASLYGCNVEGDSSMTQGGMYITNMSILNSQNNFFHEFTTSNRQAVYCNNGNALCVSDNFENNFYAVRALRDSSIDLDNECRLVGHSYALYAQRGGLIDGFDTVGSDNDYIARVADGGTVLVDDVNVGYNIAVEYLDSAGGFVVHQSDNYGVRKIYDLIYEVNSVDPIKTMTAYESGRQFRNGTDAAEMNLCSAEKGLTVTIMIGSANYFKINAASDDRIVMDGVDGALAGYIRSNVKGSVIKLTCIDGTNWEDVYKKGTWTADV